MSRICFPIILLLLTIASYAQSSMEQFIDKAYGMSRQGQTEEAISVCNEAIRKFPNEPMLYMVRGDLKVNHIKQLATNENLYNAALQDFNKALQLDSAFVAAYHNRALLNLYFQKYDLAIVDFSQVIKSTEDENQRFNAMADRASAKGYNKDYPGAIQDYDALIRMRPHEIDLYLNQGAMFSRLQQYDRAQALYKRGLEINPADPGLLNNMGILMNKMGNYREGITYCKKAIEINPDEPFAYNNVGFALIKINEPKEALQYINKSLSIYAQNSYAYKNRALALIAMGNDKEACADLAKAIELGYSKSYDDEVEKLMEKHCKK